MSYLHYTKLGLGIRESFLSENFDAYSYLLALIILQIGLSRNAT